jgi:hypothetical protein
MNTKNSSVNILPNPKYIPLHKRVGLIQIFHNYMILIQKKHHKKKEVILNKKTHHNPKIKYLIVIQENI